MSWKAYTQRNTSSSVSRICTVCGKRFFAHSHQRMCRKCKKVVGRRRIIGRES